MIDEKLSPYDALYHMKEEMPGQGKIVSSRGKSAAYLKANPNYYINASISMSSTLQLPYCNNPYYLMQ